MNGDNFKMRNYFSKKRGFSNKGFTMVELIVAMAVFIVLLTVAVGTFVKIMRTQRGLIDRMAVNSNTGLVLEQIVREIRTGYFFCGDGTSACNESGSSISFINHEGKSISYSLSGGAIIQTIGGNSVVLTAADVLIKDLNFQVTQADGNICNPWRITVKMKIASRDSEPERDVKIQSTVSSRVLPVEAPETPQEVIDRCQLYD
jgi:prepilin-type N-terminal cleavage/methylation domain-containing protein